MRIELKKNMIHTADIHKKEEYIALVTKRSDDSR